MAFVCPGAAHNSRMTWRSSRARTHLFYRGNMAKRFTATDKWEDSWFRNLTSMQKCVWIYICDRCDNSGVWKVDIELANFFLGHGAMDGLTILEAFNNGKERVTVLNSGSHWLNNDFIGFQFGELKEECAPHRGVLKLIHSHSRMKGYPKGNVTLKDKDKEKPSQDKLF